MFSIILLLPPTHPTDSHFRCQSGHCWLIRQTLWSTHQDKLYHQNNCFNFLKYFSLALARKKLKVCVWGSGFSILPYSHCHKYRGEVNICQLSLSKIVKLCDMSYCLLPTGNLDCYNQLCSVQCFDYHLPDCPVERLPILPIHTGLIPQLSSAQVLEQGTCWFECKILSIC